jgi:hypothetical protein
MSPVNRGAQKSMGNPSPDSAEAEARSAAITPFDRVANAVTSARPSIWLVSGYVALLTLLRLVLATKQGMCATGISPHDETLFVKLAFLLKHGGLAANYDELALSKGLLYPLWIAGVSSTGLSLTLAQQLLYAIACAVTVYVMRPFLKSGFAALALYVVLLYCPAFFTESTQGTLREGIYVSLTLLVVACATAVWIRAAKPLRAAPWAIGLGVFGGVFWIIRWGSEGFWLVPLLLLPLSTPLLLWKAGRIKPAAVLKGLAPWGLALAVGLAPVVAMAAANERTYGVFLLDDASYGSFVKAYGAMTRVVPEHWVANVPVPRDVRLKEYAVSPAFAELEPLLEGDVGAAWMVEGNASDVTGGWFIWAVREAAAKTGHYATAPEAQRYFQQVANEINAACNSGKLECVGPRATLRPPLRAQYAPLFLGAFARSVVVLAIFFPINPEPSKSVVPPAMAAEIRSMTHGYWVGIDPAPAGRPAAMVLLRVVLTVYQLVMPFAFVAALLGTRLVVQEATKRSASAAAIAKATLVLTLLCCGLGRAALVSIVDATSFPAVDPSYLAPAYDLLLIWAFISIPPWVAERRARRTKRRIAASPNAA